MRPITEDTMQARSNSINEKYWCAIYLWWFSVYAEQKQPLENRQAYAGGLLRSDGEGDGEGT